MRAKLAVLAVAGLAAGAGAAWLAGSYRPFVAYQTANVPFCLIVGWSFIGCGLIAWQQRPGNQLGPVMIFVGFAGQAFTKEVQKEVGVGGTVKIGPYELLLQAMDQKQEKNYVAERMIVEVMRDHKPVMILFPERRNFPAGEESGTMVAIYSTLREDLYVVYAGINQGSQVPTIHVFLNPLVKWVWFGGLVVVLGTLVALLPSRHAALALAGTKAPEAAREFGDAVPSSVALREGHD